MKTTIKTLLLTGAATTLATAAAHAQNAGNTWGGRMAAMGQDTIQWGSMITMALYVLCGFFLIAAGVALFGLARRNGNSSPAIFACSVLAAVACASAPTILNLTSQTVTGAAPSVTGTGAAPIQFN